MIPWRFKASETQLVHWQRPQSRLRPLLNALALGYGKISTALYDLRHKRAVSVAVPVISVGSLTAGGTAKSTISSFLMARLLSWGYEPVIICRGYGRRSRSRKPLWVKGTDNWLDVGDEALMMANKVGDGRVLVHVDRLAAAYMAINKGHDVLILDDGFQSSALHRDLEILTWSTDRPPWQDSLIPAGRLRYPSTFLAKADLMWEHGPQAPHSSHNIPLKQRVSSHYEIDTLSYLTTGEASPKDLRGKRVGLFAGIARPQRFEKLMLQTGAQVLSRLFIADHGEIPVLRLQRWLTQGKEAGVEAFYCTEKDVCKLRNFPELARHFRCVHISLALTSSESALDDALRCILSGASLEALKHE